MITYIENTIKEENNNFKNLIIKQINIHKVDKKLNIVTNLSVNAKDGRIIDFLNFITKLLVKLEEKYKNWGLNIILE